MTYGYARVSSRGQELKGNSLEAQEKALKERGCKKIYREAYTGTTMDRPVFSEVLGLLKTGDTLMVTKLDRFARTANEGYDVVKELVERGVSVDVLNMGRVDDTITGRLMLHILFAFAEYEHDTILERLNSGKEIKKMSAGYREGRKKKPYDAALFTALNAAVSSEEMTVKAACEKLGVSRGKWYRLQSDRVSV